MPKVGVRSALLNILDLKTMLSGMSHYLSLSLYLFSKTTYNFLMFLANSQAREMNSSRHLPMTGSLIADAKLIRAYPSDLGITKKSIIYPSTLIIFLRLA